MNPYPEYKDSGVEWIGEIPVGWKCIKIKYLTENYDANRIPLSAEERLSQKRIFPYYGANGIIDYVEDYIFDGTFILIGEDGAPFYNKNENVSLVAEGKFWVNNHCHILKSSDYVDARFISHCLNSTDYSEFITGSTRDKLTQSDLNRILLPIPPLTEQTQIVSYLDTKTQQIDQLIQNKEQKIKLLQEKRTAVINHAVSKGLNPDVEMKDSGVEWIGKIPVEWNMVRLKFLGESIIGLSYKPTDIVDGQSQGVLVLRSSNIQNRKLSLNDCVYVNTEAPEKLIVREGDILICSRSGSRELVGKNITIDSRSVGCTFGVFMTIFRSSYWKFISCFLNSPIFENQSGLFTTSTINQLTTSTLNNMHIPFPSNTLEQSQIANYLEEKTQQIDDLIGKEQRKIELLKEYRQSLISDAVTGKIDVREAV